MYSGVYLVVFVFILPFIAVLLLIVSTVVMYSYSVTLWSFAGGFETEHISWVRRQEASFW